MIPMPVDHFSSLIMSTEVLPVIVTSFKDFELEERVIRVLSHMGFPIGRRKILGEREIAPGEILVTDQVPFSPEIPAICLPKEMQRVDDTRLHHFFARHFIPIGESIRSGVVVTGGSTLIGLRGELLESLASFGARYAPFEEGDRNLALIPTRRREELLRLARFSESSIAIFLLEADRTQLELAQSFIEYRRRIHPHLEIAFVTYGGRKQIKSEISANLEPFTIFWVDDERDDLFRLSWRKRLRGPARFRHLAEWIGSRHGGAYQPRNLLDHTRRERDRSPFGIGGAVATSR